jgi:hypothetical protein
LRFLNFECFIYANYICQGGIDFYDGFEDSFIFVSPDRDLLSCYKS